MKELVNDFLKLVRKRKDYKLLPFLNGKMSSTAHQVTEILDRTLTNKVINFDDDCKYKLARRLKNRILNSKKRKL